MATGTETPSAEATLAGLNLAITLYLRALGEQMDARWLIDSLMQQRKLLDQLMPEQQVARGLLESAVTYLNATIAPGGSRGLH